MSSTHDDVLDFSSPFVPPASKAATTPTGSGPPEDAVAMVMALGFTRDQAIKALKATVSLSVLVLVGRSAAFPRTTI